MFKDDRGRRSYIAVLVTFALDLVGFSIVFPILAPLLLEPDYGFFPAETSEIYRTTMLGIAFALFAFAQFIASPLIGAAADHLGRRRLFLVTIGLSVVGYAIMALSLYLHSLTLLFIGRFWTGTCSGNAAVAQASVADIAYPKHRAKAFSYLNAFGSVGFVAGPWLGGLLADPTWLRGMIPFLFVGAVAIFNFAIVYFFFSETYRKKQEGPLMKGLASSFQDLARVFHMPTLRHILVLYFIYLTADSLWLIFCPTYLVQRFELSAMIIGDLYAYMSLVWIATLLFFNRELLKHFALRPLSLWGAVVFGLCLLGVLLLPSPWLLLFVSVPLMAGGAITYSNMGAMVSHAAPAHFQGRALGVNASLLSLSQVFTSVIAGPLAGISMFLPLIVGALFAFLTAGLLVRYKEPAV